MKWLRRLFARRTQRDVRIRPTDAQRDATIAGWNDAISSMLFESPFKIPEPAVLPIDVCAVCGRAAPLVDSECPDCRH